MENIQKMNEKESFWGKLMRKSKVNTYDIALKTNIPEEKVKEIINGERTLPTDKVTDFVTAIHESKIENKKSKRNEAIFFFADKNLKDLRLKFNYKTQKDLAKALGVSQFTISRAESAGLSALSTSIVLKFYEFFKDELNIKIDKKETKDIKKIKNIENINRKENELDYYKNYFKENNLKELIANKGMSIPNFAKSTGINNSTIYKYLSGKIEWSLDLYKKVYNSLNNVHEDIIEEPVEISNIEEIEEPVDLSINRTGEIEDYDMSMKRVNKNVDLYTNSDDIKYAISSSFNSDALFEYLINNCITKDVVELYKLLNNYFRGE